MKNISKCMVVILLMVSATLARPSAANATVITNNLTVDLQGTGGAGWAYTQVGNGEVYAAAIAQCGSAVNCLSTAGAVVTHRANIIPIGSPIALAIIGSGLLFLPAILDVTGNTMFDGQIIVDTFGTLPVGSVASPVPYNQTIGPFWVEHGSTFQIELTAIVNSVADGVTNPGPVVGVASAKVNLRVDPEWEFAFLADQISFDIQTTPTTISEKGLRPDGIDLGEAEPPSVPLPPTVLFVISAFSIFGACRYRHQRLCPA